MIPSVDDFLRGVAFYARRHGLSTTYDSASIGEALVEAARLADGRDHDEPAALFFACARRSRAFGKVAEHVMPFIAQNHARALGFVLDLDKVALSGCRAGVLRGELTYDHPRAWFSERLRPVPP